jgi:XTP/dITP diphosphohydrolase
MPNPIELRFVSRNQHKLDEAKKILAPLGVSVTATLYTIEELQTNNTDRLVKDKALKAFRHLGEPVFVEHTGLYLDELNGLPGGLTQIFWDTLEADRFSELFGQKGHNRVLARTVIAYIDGKRVYLFSGEVGGTITCPPRGTKDFQWDCVFVPDGHDKTFAEMGDAKNCISMRKKALDQFASHFTKGPK